MKNRFEQLAEVNDFEIESIEISEYHVQIFWGIPFDIFDYRSFTEGSRGEPAREIFNGYPEVKRELWGGENWEDGYFVWDCMR